MRKALVVLLWIALLSPGVAFLGPRVAMYFSGGGVYSIPGASMAPLLLEGDVLLALPLEEDTVLHRGDVIVFSNQAKAQLVIGEDSNGVDLDLSTSGRDAVDYVKRVIGLPGDRVQMVEGMVHLNGSALEQGRFGDWIYHGMAAPIPDVDCWAGRPSSGHSCKFEQWIENLPDTTRYAILNIRQTPLDDTPVFDVPEDHVFVLGDHRDNSIDSRSSNVGFVPIDRVKHRAWMVQWSFDGWEPRLDRLFKRVN